jgi:hypothetical protein
MLNSKFIKNKKGLDYAVLLALIVVPFALVGLYLSINNAMDQNKDLGYNQIEMLKTANTKEKTNFYVNIAAKNSLDKSIYDFGLNSGIFDKSKCKTYKDYIIWQSSLTNCYPDIDLEFALFFKQELTSYLELNEQLKQTELTISHSNNKIIGNFHKDIELKIKNQDNKEIGTYFFNPSFTINTNFDIEEEIIQKSKEIFNYCIIENNTKDCVEAQFFFKGLQDTWQVDFSNNVAFFEVSTNKDIWVYKDSKLVNEKHIVKFALDFAKD